MDFPITELLYIKYPCNDCKGEKVVTDAAGNGMPCPRCSGIGDVYQQVGSYEDLKRMFEAKIERHR